MKASQRVTNNFKLEIPGDFFCPVFEAKQAYWFCVCPQQ